MAGQQRAYDVHRVEAAWNEAWDRAACHVAEDRPSRDKYFVHDATPFPNGPLHMGHVRCYVLGDVVARYQRLLGRSVLYHTGFDAFGLPIELAALERGIPPRRLVRSAIAEQTGQLKRLGISYDWNRIADTSEPSTYRWTQWLFLEMRRAGLVERREGPLDYCPDCETGLARLQVEDGRCWRCGTRVETRSIPQWTVLLSRYVPFLRRSLDELDGWSPHARRALAAMLDDPAGGARGQGGADWIVSRQRSWGTPIPIVHCPNCGPVSVPDADLPVVLPDELDWASGSGALARDEAFVATACPQCDRPARRETDTLDCSFDDAWCYFQTHVLGSDPPGFTRENLAAWLPVDRSQSGRDTYPWFHLYRFLGAFLHERGLLEDPHFIRGFFGHDLVLAGGRKMSKHLGNVVAPDAILETEGADALRVAMIWAGGPQRAVVWNPALLDRATALLDAVYELFAAVAAVKAPGGSGQQPSRKAHRLADGVVLAMSRVARFIDEYRPNAAIETLARLVQRLRQFALPRVESGRLEHRDTAVLHDALDDVAVALAPFAPHLAEEVWRLRGHATLVAQARWPRPRAGG